MPGQGEIKEEHDTWRYGNIKNIKKCFHYHYCIACTLFYCVCIMPIMKVNHRGSLTAPNITFLSLLQRYFLCMRQRHRCFPEESKIIQSVGRKSDKNPVNIWSNNSSQKAAVWITVIKFNLGSNLIWILLKDHLTFLLCHQCISNYRVSAFRFADCLSACKPHFKRQGLLEVFSTSSGHFSVFFTCFSGLFFIVHVLIHYKRWHT